MSTQLDDLDREVPLAAAALDVVENMIVITDRDGDIVYVNPAFSAVTGYEVAEAIGGNPRLLRSGVQDDAFYTDLWDCILAGESWSGELVNRRKNGELYTDRMTITPLRDDAGEVAHFIAVKRDVSSHLAALTAGNPAGIAHTDRSGRLVYANDRLSMLLDAPFEQLLGRGWLEAMGEDAAAQIESALARLDAKVAATCVLDLPDRRSLRVGLAPLQLAEDAVAGVVATFEDVTAERETLRRLAEREAFVRSILESLDTATAVVDVNGVVTHVNRAWLETPHLAGQRGQQAAGTDYRGLWDRGLRSHSEQADDVLAVVERVLSPAAESESVDYRIGDDEPRWWELRATPLASAAGGAVLTHTDVTWRRDLQAELEVQARTDALTGLANRVGLLKEGEKVMARSRRDDSPVAVLFVDLDRFKPINDTHGHDAGDVVLQTCAERLRDVVREVDVVARVGGDEFVVVCEGLAPQDVEKLESRIVVAMSAPIDVGVPVTVGVSLGMVQASGHDDFAQTIADADARMYEVKRAKPERHG